MRACSQMYCLNELATLLFVLACSTQWARYLAAMFSLLEAEVEVAWILSMMCTRARTTAQRGRW